MENINNLNDFYIGKSVQVTEQSRSSKSNTPSVRTFNGILLDLIPNSWIMVGNEGIPLISVGSGVREVKLNDGTIIYRNALINEEFNPRSIEEVFISHANMFGIEEAKRIYRIKIDEIREYSPEVANEYSLRLHI